MTTKPDFTQVNKLIDEFTPATRGIISDAEVKQVRTSLELNDRNEIELQNIRNAAVILYGQRADARKSDVSKTIAIMDAMSAVCHVIDMAMSEKGML